MVSVDIKPWKPAVPAGRTVGASLTRHDGWIRRHIGGNPFLEPATGLTPEGENLSKSGNSRQPQKGYPIGKERLHLDREESRSNEGMVLWVKAYDKNE
jgi:hypothetical protein